MEDQSLNILQLVFGTASITVTLTSFIIILLYNFQRKQFVFQKEMDDLRFNYETSLLKSQLQAQEQTFHRISQEIHDSILLDLTLSKLYLNTLKCKHAIPREEKIKTSIKVITAVIEKLKDISKGLNTDLIKEAGLLNAIENEIEMIKKTGLFRINYTIKGVSRTMDCDKALIIFRALQESLNNTVKHSRASTITLEVAFQEDMLDMLLADDGVGFNPEQLEKTKNLQCAGLKNIRDRVRMLEGTYEITSAIGHGTLIKIGIPFTNL